MKTDAVLGRLPTWLIVLVVPVITGVALLVTSAASGNAGGAMGRSGTVVDTVNIKNFSFAPNRIMVHPGQPITVVNDDKTTHTVTANDGTFNTGDLAGGRRSHVTVARAGTYAYHCEIHPFMKGIVQVAP